MKRIKLLLITGISSAAILMVNGCAASESPKETTTEITAAIQQTETVPAVQESESEIESETQSLEAQESESEEMTTSPLSAEEVSEMFPVEILALPSGELTVVHYQSEGVKGKKGYFAETQIKTNLSPEVIANYYQDKIGAYDKFELESVDVDCFRISAVKDNYEVIVLIDPSGSGAVVNLAVIEE